MHKKVLSLVGTLLLLLTAGACSIPSGGGTRKDTLPDRLIIDTYDPVTVGPIANSMPGDGGSSVPANFNTVATLFREGNLVTPVATDDGNAGRPGTAVNGSVQPAYQGFAYIDFPGPLAAGSYYVRIRSATLDGVHRQAYALRVLSAANPDYTSWVFAGPPMVPSNDVSSTSATPISLNSKATRLIVGGATNWFKITLP